MGATRLVAAATMLLVAAGAVRAGPTQLVLTVARGEAAGPVLRRATLTCQPPGGTHRHARAACAQLAEAGGQFDRLAPAGGACTMQYDPVTVTATGRWQGRRISYEHTFGNACLLASGTGAVFSL